MYANAQQLKRPKLQRRVEGPSSKTRFVCVCVCDVRDGFRVLLERPSGWCLLSAKREPNMASEPRRLFCIYSNRTAAKREVPTQRGLVIRSPNGVIYKRCLHTDKLGVVLIASSEKSHI